MRTLFTFALVAATLATWPSSGQAQWKWRDAQGRVTMSDRPPPSDVPAGNILLRPTAAEPRRAAPADRSASQAQVATAAPAAAASGTDPELDARRRKLEQENLAKRKEAEDKHAAAMKENCQRARSHLATLDSGVRVAGTNDKGEREVLDDAQRAAETARTREVIASSCK